MTDKTDIWMPLYIGDYLAATTHLSAAESGAYLHLLMHQWKNGKLPAESDSLRRIARVEPAAWRHAWPVLQPFFDHAGGFPVQLRLEAIRAEWNEKKSRATTKAKAAADARWSNPHQHDPRIASGDAQALLQPCPSSSPSSSPSSLTTLTKLNISPITSHDKATLIAKRLQAETTLKDWKLQLDLTTVALGEIESGLHEDAVFAAMAKAWREFSEARPRLEKPWGALSFFGHGYWKDKAGWPWKPGMAPRPAETYRTALDEIREQEARDARP